MNNLEKAKRALSGKKKFRIDIDVPHYYSVKVEARDEKEANELAWKIFNEGKAIDDGDGDADISQTQEID